MALIENNSYKDAGNVIHFSVPQTECFKHPQRGGKDGKLLYGIEAVYLSDLRKFEFIFCNTTRALRNANGIDAVIGISKASHKYPPPVIKAAILV